HPAGMQKPSPFPSGGIGAGRLNHRLMAGKPPACGAAVIPEGCRPLAGGGAQRHPRTTYACVFLTTPAGVAANIPAN
ncbi:MAG: hypothetical protein ACOYOU_07625, partial [Kiritimatiellia bacterium]